MRSSHSFASYRALVDQLAAGLAGSSLVTPAALAEALQPDRTCAGQPQPRPRTMCGLLTTRSGQGAL